MAMDPLLLGIDIGTTGAKAVIFDMQGHPQSNGQVEYPLSHPRPGWAEQDPRDWWKATCLALSQALSGIMDGGNRVAGIAVSSQAPTMLAVTGDGHPLRPAIIWMDRRSEIEACRIRDTLGSLFIEQTTGNRADAFYVAPKILWFREHEPGLFAQTRFFIQANGYIGWKLTSHFGMDNVHAALLQLREQATGDWSQSLCQICGVEPTQFPPVLAGHDLLGEVTEEASQATGLRAGIPVMAGTVDGAAAAMEAGAVTAGSAAEMTGTSTVLLIAADQAISNSAFIAMPHALQGLHLLLGAISCSGASLRWFRDQLGAGPGTEYDLLTREAAQIAPGSQGVVFLPYLMGERSPLWDTSARGVFFGITLSTTKGMLIRSILEGVSFALKHNLEVARSAGLMVNTIRSVGGGTRSELWNQIKADVLGIPVRVTQMSCGAPFGDAILAGVGLGEYADPRGTIKAMIRDRAVYAPDTHHHQKYDAIYRIYRSIYEQLRDAFKAAMQLNETTWAEISK